MNPKQLLPTLTQLLLLCAVIFCSYTTYTISKEQQVLKEDRAAFQDIRYGLFNMRTWADRMAVALQTEISDFQLSGGQRSDLEQMIGRMLETAAGEAGEWADNSEVGKLVNPLIGIKSGFGNLFSRDKKKKTAGTMVEDMVIDMIPELTDQIMAELDKPEARKKFSEFMQSKLREFVDNNIGAVSTAPLDPLITYYGCDEIDDCVEQINAQIKTGDIKMWKYASAASVMGIVIFLLLLVVKTSEATVAQFYIVMSAALVLLTCGIVTPMIDLDARVDALTVEFMSHDIVFNDQVLFFQSKSIWDIVILLVQTGEWLMLFVAVCVVLFSVIFPVLKMSASTILLHRPHLKSNCWLSFFAFKLSKWSMADVFVVAIMLSYLGFRGLMSSQLQRLAPNSENIQLIATNKYTDLQPGFLCFTAFVLIGIALAQWLEKRVHAQSKIP